MASSTIKTKVGIFGADLTDFYADCAIASTLCTASTYHAYSGWALGVEITWTTTAADAATTGVCFEKDKNCVIVQSVVTTPGPNVL